MFKCNCVQIDHFLFCSFACFFPLNLHQNLPGLFSPNASGESSGDKAEASIDDDWVVRKFAHIRRRSRSIDSALGETPTLFPTREEENIASSSPTRQDKPPSPPAIRHSCSAIGDGGGSGGDDGGGGVGGGGGARDTEVRYGWWRAGVETAVSGDTSSFVDGEIDAKNFRGEGNHALTVEYVCRPTSLRSS